MEQLDVKYMTRTGSEIINGVPVKDVWDSLKVIQALNNGYIPVDEVIKRAADNPALRAQLTTDPNAALLKCNRQEVRFLLREIRIVDAKDASKVVDSFVSIPLTIMRDSTVVEARAYRQLTLVVQEPDQLAAALQYLNSHIDSLLNSIQQIESIAARFNPAPKMAKVVKAAAATKKHLSKLQDTIRSSQQEARL